MKPEDLGAYYESLLEREVRKEGGISYTPPPIVDYMVADAVGELLQGKTPSEAAKIKIVDPACGGGVFCPAHINFCSIGSNNMPDFMSNVLVLSKLLQSCV